MKTMTQLTLLALLSASSGSVYATLTTTTTYDGSGNLGLPESWSNGFPTNANPGLITSTTGAAGLPGYVNDIAIRLTGGSVERSVAVTGNGNFAMRGGLAGTTDSTILEIDDQANSDFTYTNFYIEGQLTMWSQFDGNRTELRVLNGYAELGSISAVSPGLSDIDILNGKLDIGVADAIKMNVNMLSGGTGEIVLGDLNGRPLIDMDLDFASGSQASFTILENAGSTIVGAWESYVTGGNVTIDGVATTDLSAFEIENTGSLGSTISLIPEPSSAAILFGCASFLCLSVRRRSRV